MISRIWFSSFCGDVSWRRSTSVWQREHASLALGRAPERGTGGLADMNALVSRNGKGGRLPHAELLAQKRPLLALLVDHLTGRLAGPMAGLRLDLDQDRPAPALRCLER